MEIEGSVEDFVIKLNIYFVTLVYTLSVILANATVCCTQTGPVRVASCVGVHLLPWKAWREGVLCDLRVRRQNKSPFYY